MRQHRSADRRQRPAFAPVSGLWDATTAESGGAVLVLDEVQKIAGWSETVKRLWDEDARAR
ncbi:MAG: hypothetical protein ABIT71_13355, partial [Vicinamibacteraceae bacterium]